MSILTNFFKDLDRKALVRGALMSMMNTVQRMAEEFMRESDEAIASGDHQMVQLDPGGGRVFGDDEEEAEKMKRKIMIEGA